MCNRYQLTEIRSGSLERYCQRTSELHPSSPRVDRASSAETRLGQKLGFAGPSPQAIERRRCRTKPENARPSAFAPLGLAAPLAHAVGLVRPKPITRCPVVMTRIDTTSGRPIDSRPVER